MTDLKINISGFSRIVGEAREEWENWEEIYEGNYRRFLTEEIKNKRHFWQPLPVRTAEDLRRECSVAATRAMQYAASGTQIDEIVRLATISGDFRETGYSILDKSRAAILIKIMREGV